MSREWKPGDVLIWRDRMRVIYTDGNQGPRWVFADGSDAPASGDTLEHPPGRPLVVIDPEDRGALERLLELLNNAEQQTHPGLRNVDCGSGSCWIDCMQQALREFANPTPPKPAVTVEMVKAMQQQVQMDREQSAYWKDREVDHGGLSAVDAWLDSLADWLGADDA